MVIRVSCRLEEHIVFRYLYDYRNQNENKTTWTWVKKGHVLCKEILFLMQLFNIGDLVLGKLTS